VLFVARLGETSGALFHKRTRLPIMNVQSIIGPKQMSVATIACAARLKEAVALLDEHGIGALVVADDGRTIDGIVSERDIVRALAGEGTGALESTVGSVMSANVITCVLGDGVDHLMQLMTDRRVRHLPVVDDSAFLIGIVSIGDVVKARLTQLEHENQALSQYISGH
jgi:CBS-domain-containing membrane protein